VYTPTRVDGPLGVVRDFASDGAAIAGSIAPDTGAAANVAGDESAVVFAALSTLTAAAVVSTGGWSFDPHPTDATTATTTDHRTANEMYEDMKANRFE
jgi:hypothetical protein